MDGGDLRASLRRVLRVCARGLVGAAAATLGVPLFVASVVSIANLPDGIGIPLTPRALLGVRALADRHRDWAARWSGVSIPSPYRPRPPAATGLRQALRLCRWLLTDPATWRDLLWAIVNVPVGIFLGVLPASLIVNGLGGILVAPWLWALTPHHDLYWGLSIPAGALYLVAGLTLSPYIQRAHALFTQSLLAPTRAQLAGRVEALVQTRSHAVDASAAELRRIERDLHDGAQARLITVGMNIGLAERMVKNDPDLALTLLAEARQSSGAALAELRDLVRGIHPPVLVERGLGGAVHALALALPIPVAVAVDLPARPPAPVESAMYFAVAEALANVAKHSAASRAAVRLGHRDGVLTVTVTDDGAGGARPRPGGGLHGIQQRLAAFDGTIALTSPPAGPTTLTLELPCALSSQRTSPSCETG
jgi:signal transduction histidine kinase